jgi:predicted TIM-barrel fold metal-dependent hydrolase
MIGLPRRDFLTGVMAFGAMAAAPPSLLARARPRRIDVHYHPITPEWIAEDAVQKTLGPVLGTAKGWTPARAIEEMDRNEVETAVCSVSNPGISFGDVEQGRRLARACNEYSARLARDNPGRFASFAALPLPDIDGSLGELTYALDTLHAEGVGLFSSYDDKWVADPSFAPVFQELNRRKAVVYVHPTAPSCCRNLVPGIPAVLLEYPIDTSRTILQWIASKSAALYPDVRLIFSHAGGLIMAGIGRLQLLSEALPAMRLPTDFPAEIAKLYFEISSSADARTMAALRSYVPTSHILLGTDSPFIGSMAPNLEQLQKLGLPKSDLAAIERGNAVSLMPRLGVPR